MQLGMSSLPLVLKLLNLSDRRKGVAPVTRLLPTHHKVIRMRISPDYRGWEKFQIIAQTARMCLCILQGSSQVGSNPSG